MSDANASDTCQQNVSLNFMNDYYFLSRSLSFFSVLVKVNIRVSY